MIDDGGRAFPSGLVQDSRQRRQFAEAMERGISVRTWLAGRAMQGMLSNPWLIERYGADANNIAKKSLFYAEALIAALNEKMT